MPILIETIDPETTPIQQKSLNETGWTGFNSPRSSNVGQTRGPAGMGMNAYVDRPETQPNWVPFKPSDLGYESNVGSSMQTRGPAGMGMNAYVNRPETQVGPRFGPPANIGLDRAGYRGGPPANIGLDRAGLGIFGGNNYAANDIVNAIMGGMNKSQGAGAKLMAEADSYTPQNLIQMYEDALDAGNEDEAEMYLNDLQLRYPTLVAELTQEQKDYMKNPYFSPGLETAPSADELFNQVKDREYKGSWWPEILGGSGPQEPTTREEFDEYYNELQKSFYA